MSEVLQRFFPIIFPVITGISVSFGNSDEEENEDDDDGFGLLTIIGGVIIR